MKIVVTHTSPDLDAIASVWLIKKFLQDWADAGVEFVQAGEKISNIKNQKSKTEPIEKVGQDEYIHVDTGLGPLDHHQTEDASISAVNLTWGYIKNQISKIKYQKEETEKKWEIRKKAVDRMAKVIVEIDHFKELFRENPMADYHEFTLSEMLEGLKLAKPDNDLYYLDFGMKALDGLLHNFENRIGAEREIKENGIKFDTRFGKGIGFETLNDSVLKLAQRMGYVVVLRKDPRKGYVRIKARPSQRLVDKRIASSSKEQLNAKRSTLNTEIDLMLAYEKLKKMDPEATWFLHVSKKMLLNGTTKNPKMKATTLSLKEIIKVLENI